MEFYKQTIRLDKVIVEDHKKKKVNKNYLRIPKREDLAIVMSHAIT